MNRFFGIMAGFLLACLSAAAQTPMPIRVNCGGPSYTDSNGQVWKADYRFSTGLGTANTSITTGTGDPVLYQTNRFSQTATPLISSFPVANGNYRLNLLFSENSGGQQAVGARVLNVKINGATVLQNFNIFASAGANAALVEGFNATATNGTMTIEFAKLEQNPKVDAIEILPIVGVLTLTMKFTYPDGSAVSGALHHAVSTSSLTLGGSVVLANGQATWALVTSPNVLGLIGQTQVALNLTDATGNVVWQVFMGLNPASTDLSSVPSSTLNVVLTKP